MSQVKSTIFKAISATALVTSLMLPQLARAKWIQLPSEPVAPTDFAECNELEKQYNPMLKQIDELVDQGFRQWQSHQQTLNQYQIQWNELWAERYKIMNARSAAGQRCRDKVIAYNERQRAERQQADAQRQQAAAQQQAQQQSAMQQRSQQALNTHKQVQQAGSVFNTGKSFLTSPKATLGGIVANGIAGFLGSLATPKTPLVDDADIKSYDAAHELAGNLADKAISNPVASLLSTAAMEKLRLHNIGMLNTMGEVARDIQTFGADELGNANQPSGSNWSWSTSTRGVPVNIPESSIDASDPDPLGKFLDSVDTKSWDAQVTDYQTGLRESMANKSGQIAEAMNWIDQNQSQQIQDIGNSYASASPAADRQSQGNSGFAIPSSYSGTNDNLAMASIGGQTNCAAARPYIQQANENRRVINEIKAQESTFRSGYGSANIDKYLAMLKDGVKVNEAEAAKLCPR